MRRVHEFVNWQMGKTNCWNEPTKRLCLSTLFFTLSRWRHVPFSNHCRIDNVHYRSRIRRSGHFRLGSYTDVMDPAPSTVVLLDMDGRHRLLHVCISFYYLYADVGYLFECGERTVVVVVVAVVLAWETFRPAGTSVAPFIPGSLPETALARNRYRAPATGPAAGRLSRPRSVNSRAGPHTGFRVNVHGVFFSPTRPQRCAVWTAGREENGIAKQGWVGEKNKIYIYIHRKRVRRSEGERKRTRCDPKVCARTRVYIYIYISSTFFSPLSGPICLLSRLFALLRGMRPGPLVFIYYFSPLFSVVHRDTRYRDRGRRWYAHTYGARLSASRARRR